MILRYQQTEAWKVSMDLVGEVFGLTAQLVDDARLCMVADLRGIAISIPSTVAKTVAEHKQGRDQTVGFTVAYSMCYQLETLLQLGCQLNYFQEEEVVYVREQLEKTKGVLGEQLQKPVIRLN